MIQEVLHDKVCLSASYNSVKLNNKCNIIMDSGAFKDRNKHTRLSYEDAYNRQIMFEEKLKYKSNYIVPYDNIDDIESTLMAHKWMINNVMDRNIIGVVQGNTVEEKLKCYDEIVDMGIEYIGFGGIAKIGVNKKKRKMLFDVLKSVSNPSEKMHFFGVGNLLVLQECRNILGNDIYMSCDTSVIEIGSVMGRVFNNGIWKKVYTAEDEKNGIYHPKNLYDLNVHNILPFYEVI